MSLLSKIFGDANLRIIHQLQQQVEEINRLEEKTKAFSVADFKTKTREWQKKLKDKPLEEQQKILEEILPAAFALVRAAAQRTLSQRHYDVQLVAGMVLHQGKISEMKTGEGKTLAATTALYLNALTGRGVHLITVNDYLARRDTVWMGQVYDYLGLTVGCLNHETAYIYDRQHLIDHQADEERDTQGAFKVVDDFLKPVARQQAYAADITYGTNNEFGFDYLRDNMVQSLEQKVQRELHYAIIDEVDSILIDEARTPLIISAPDTESTEKYQQFAQLVVRLKENEDYNIDEKMHAATLTEEGVKKMENWLGVENIYTDRGIREVHHIEQALKAQVLFKKDRDYVVREGEVIIVDEFTGRLMPGRRYSEGLHQAIEAKEGVTVQRESVTMATITFQNYFRMYKKLAGMTGTAATEAEEFSKIYNLDVITVPTNRPMVREDKSDVIFKTQLEKYQAIIHEIKNRNKNGQPILVGTISIENNEYLSSLLAREGIEHKVLNAKHHEQEAEIIAQAGRQGAVTIATNMAGRGVDIVLGGNPSTIEEQETVSRAGGLCVLGSERHESRRIDNQLRGRSGRQGDPGVTQFFVSMEDDLMRIFGGERMKKMMQALGLPEGTPIENRMISSSIEKAQRKVEGHNFDIRKHLVEYDDVVNKHREVIYRKRNKILELSNPPMTETGVVASESETRATLLHYLREEIESVVSFHAHSELESEWNLEEIYETMNSIFPVAVEARIKIEEIKEQQQANREKNQATTNSALKELIDYLYGLALAAYKQLTIEINNNENLKSQLKDIEPMSVVEKMVLLRAIDMLWVEHIDAMDHMRTGIGLRGYGQKDPLVEYKKEAYRMFNELLVNIRKQAVYSIFKISLADSVPQNAFSAPVDNRQLNFSGPAKTGAISNTAAATSKSNSKLNKSKIGRNDPCPCGAVKPDGKPIKYKHCHGK